MPWRSMWRPCRCGGRMAAGRITNPAACMFDRKIRRLCVIALLCASTQPSFAHPDLINTYQEIPNSVVLPGGLHSQGDPSEVVSRLPRPATDADGNPTADPAKFCLELGPFRAMARPDTKFEFMPGADGRLFMLFEDIPHDNMRMIRFNPPFPAKPDPSAHGTAIGHWEGDTLVIETSGLDTSTWLNDAGARHSDELKLDERITPILNGAYLEYRATATDPKAFAKRYSYTRYFERTDSMITQYDCDIEG